MRPFMDEDFLLTTPAARTLYHQYAKSQPIIDYHCHVSPKEIYEDRHFENISQVWLSGDHYKWRLMRSNGVDEHYITSGATDWEKFRTFAETLPKAIGNPMYHWCHLELQRYFGYDGVLSGGTAQEVWDLCAEKLARPDMGVRGLIRMSNVAFVGTTDDPCDSLEWHKKLAEDAAFSTKVCPSFRPDPALNIHKPGFADYMKKLGEAAGMEIRSIADVRSALTARIGYFDAHGCRASDHGLDYMMYREITDEQADNLFAKVMAGGIPTKEEAEGWQTALLLHCAREYLRVGWAMQLHFSCVRNPNSRMLARLGPDTGFDCMAAADNCAAAYHLMDALERDGQLPRIILYSLNPADNAWLDTLIGAFQGPEVPGKLQHGAAWWFNDSMHGMREHMTSLASLSLLGNFVGMLTDSRSFLSYTRHEYFRRILCDLLGGWVEQGHYPDDPALVGGIVEDICYRNAKRYFRI